MQDHRPTLSDNAVIGIINRGEAALRCIRAVRDFNTLRDTHLKTVAFYAPGEEESWFVQEADAAEPLVYAAADGPRPATPYLDKPLLMDALQRTGCTAVWVGWGFVSEDAEFASLVERAGLVFLGPDARAMALLGDKIEAKRLAAQANVPILPWSEGPVADLEAARVVAQRLEYPVIVKAAHAGGGRGIRFVRTAAELESQFRSAMEETVRVTGGNVVFMERLVVTGRHLEVQCLCDGHGTVRTFGVRDCSVQRRNQKIVEETPPPRLSPAQVAEIEGAAQRLMHAAAYRSAGTVEFLFDVDRNEFYFMEVNTRLQVEHPITEELYSIDLVVGQLRVARGESIADLSETPRGHVIEARLNAEDPDNGFAPSPGRIDLFVPPMGPGVRCDSGVKEGSVIPREFDSMIAKIIARGATRAEALARLERALRELRIRIEGGTTNRAFVLRLLRTGELREGGVSTAFVERLLAAEGEQPGAVTDAQAGARLVAQTDAQDDAWTDAVLACAIHRYRQAAHAALLNFRRQTAAGGSPRAVTPGQGVQTALIARGARFELQVREVAPDTYHITDQNGVTTPARYELRGHAARFSRENTRRNVQIVERGDLLQCELDGTPYRVQVESSGLVRAASPAVVLAIHVPPGTAVKRGTLLLSLEAMKMELPVSAPEAGTVREVRVRVGEQVAAAQVLVVIDSGTDESRRFAPGTLSPTALDRSPEAAWQRAVHDYRAIFLGYDVEGASRAPFERLRGHVEGNEVSASALIREVLGAVRAYAAIELLFSDRPLVGPDSARAASRRELLAHWARRDVDRGKGMHEQFLRDLAAALSLYGVDADNDAAAVDVVVRMYQSHARVTEKAEVLRRSLVLLEESGLAEQVESAREELQGAADALDTVADLAQGESRALADAAIHARYRLVDRALLRDLSARKREKIARIFDLLERHAANDAMRERLYRYVEDAPHHVVPELVRTALSGGAPRAADHALEMLARRFVRDRIVEGIEKAAVRDGAGSAGGAEAPRVVRIVGRSNTDSTTVYQTWLVVGRTGTGAELWERAARIAGGADEGVDEGTEAALREVIVLGELETPDAAGADNAWLETSAQEAALRVRAALQSTAAWRFVALGVTTPDGRYTFRTVTRADRDVVVRTAPLQMNPVQYRELRVGRLERFDTRQVYGSESCWVLAAISKDNPRDERLFAFVDVPSARVQIDEHGRVRRMVALERVFMEAVYAMRAEQARRTQRLYWNRLIIRIHSPLQLTIDQVRDYAGRLGARAADIGLERLVVYTRRPAPVVDGCLEGGVEETELLFENISGSGFTVRGRAPSQAPLTPMDAYVAKVVRARQRDTVYPYEVIKMLTRSGMPIAETFPKGEFEEFDLEQPAGASSAGGIRAVSVRGRAYGTNNCGIVFGIATNYLPTHPRGLSRVLILSDSTNDLGSLAEPECRRVIAALDLAAERGLAVEWLPVSAGARIDMESGTENLDWTAAVLRRIIEFTQAGGEINVIVANVNVGAQSYWNAEATMLMHTRGLLIMTEEASMLLTGKKALDFSGSVSGENNVAIGGAARIMAPNGQAQITVRTLHEAFSVLFRHYALTAAAPTTDSPARDIGVHPYTDTLGQGFRTIGDIFSVTQNPERKKPFEMRQVMRAVLDTDADVVERWHHMRDAETAIVWESRLGGRPVGMIGIESRALTRVGNVPHDGPETWSGGTLFPQSSKKVARALNAFSGRLPAVVMANLSGFDGSPESLRKLQLEYGAEIGRAVVNFHGPIIFVVTARYHGGAYVVFSKALNPNLHAVALEGSFASVIGGAPAAAVVFPGLIRKEVVADPRITAARAQLEDGGMAKPVFEELYEAVQAEKQAALAARFDAVHSVERARSVGSIDAIVSVAQLRPHLIERLEAAADRLR